MDNRRKGIKWEQDFIRMLCDWFELVPFDGKNHAQCQVGSSRALSKMLDDEGVDVAFTSKAPPLLQKLWIQLKRTVVSTMKVIKIDVRPLLRIEKPGIPVLVTRTYVKNGKSNIHVGDLVTIHLDDFLNFAKNLDENFIARFTTIQGEQVRKSKLPKVPAVRKKGSTRNPRRGSGLPPDNATPVQ